MVCTEMYVGGRYPGIAGNSSSLPLYTPAKYGGAGSGWHAGTSASLPAYGSGRYAGHAGNTGSLSHTHNGLALLYHHGYIPYFKGIPVGLPGVCSAAPSAGAEVSPHDAPASTNAPSGRLL